MICPDKVRQFYCRVRQLVQSGTGVPLNMPIIVDLWILHASLNLSLYWWKSTICISFTLLVFYHCLMASLLFLSCLVINVLLTYRFTVVLNIVLKSLYFPTLSAKDIYMLLTRKIDYKFELMRVRKHKLTLDHHVCVSHVQQNFLRWYSGWWTKH